MQSYKSCIFFLADGARPDIFEELLAAGQLPNIARYLVESGAYRRATTVFPSTTGPAYLPFLTGCFPGRCNVPGIRWFDRKEYARTVFSLKRFRSYVGFGSYLLNGDIHPTIRTLFQIAERPVNIISMVNKGAGFFGNLTQFSRIWYCYYAHLTDRWGFLDRTSAEKVIRSLDKNPDFVFAVLPGIDEYSHLSDPFGPYTRKAYEEMDRLIGLVVKRLQDLGRLEETLLVISSDHGLTATRKHFGIEGYLEGCGIKTFHYPLIYKRNFSAVTMVSGNGMCNVYVRGNKTWGEKICMEEMRRLSINIPQELADREEVDFVAGRSENGQVVVLSKSGEAQISRTNGQFFYRLVRGNPLGFSETPSQGLDSEHSLLHTFQSDYPDALVQLEQIFQSPRTGDLVVSAKPGYDLRDRFESPEHRASHGSLHREHMHVPLVTSAPLDQGPMRTVDLFPTILSFLGRGESQLFQNIDGVNRRRG